MMKMLLLKIKTRQKYLKTLGFYKGPINGKWDKDCKVATLKLQRKYFPAREQDSDYGPKTDILLRCAWNCRDLKYFKLEEFRCGCKGRYCTGYPAVISRSFVKKLDNKVRPKYGAMTVTSGLRCKTYNRLVGGVTNSLHLKGKAIDFACKESLKGYSARVKMIKWLKTIFKYSYGNTSGMGNAVHVND